MSFFARALCVPKGASGERACDGVLLRANCSVGMTLNVSLSIAKLDLFGLNLTDIFPLVIGSLSRFELQRTELVLVYFSFVRFS